MSLIPWRPFRDIDRFFEDWEWPEDWFEKPRWKKLVPALRAPKMDIYEEGNNVVAEVELPGVNPKNIEVEVKDNVLKVEAKSEEKKEEKKKGYYRKELSRGFYKRVVPLPVEVKGEKAEANYEEGILKITIPKVKPVKKKEEKGIKIKVKGKKTSKR